MPWIRTRVHWYLMQARCQLCHNHCTKLSNKGGWVGERITLNPYLNKVYSTYAMI